MARPWMDETGNGIRKSMIQRSIKVLARGLAGAALVGGFIVLVPDGLAQTTRPERASPFPSLAGSWSGAGTVGVPNRPRERVRCQATNTLAPSGLELHQTLRCASESYRLDVTSALLYSDGQIAGTWTERIRDASGRVSGSVTGNQIRAIVQGPGFSAALLAITRGNRQTLSLRTDRSDMPSVSIELRR